MDTAFSAGLFFDKGERGKETSERLSRQRRARRGSPLIDDDAADEGPTRRGGPGGVYSITTSSTPGVAVIGFSNLFPALATDLPDGTRNSCRDVIDNCMLRSERPTRQSTMDVDSETFTIHAAQNGSEQAWRQLFDRHFDAVYRFCLVLTGSRHHLAEELTQQVFVTAARWIHRFDPSRAAFRAWLFGVARNRHMATQTREQRRRRYEELSSRGSSETVARGVI